MTELKESYEFEKTEKDSEAVLTGALTELVDKMISKTSTGKGPRTTTKTSIKPITRILLEDAEYKWGRDLKDDAIKLEKILRKEVEENPHKTIEDKRKNEIIWNVVNYEKEQETIKEVLYKITEKINSGMENLKDEDIEKIIEEVPNKKYLKLNKILEQVRFIQEARSYIGPMYKETSEALIKYIISEKDVLKLKDFFEKNSYQKQIDKIQEQIGTKEKDPQEKEKEALLEIGQFILKTNKSTFTLEEVKKIARRENIEERPLVEKSKQLITLLNHPHTNKNRLEQIVSNLIYKEEKREKEESEIKTKYLTEIGNRYKEMNNLELANIAREYKTPITVVKNEAHYLIKKIGENKKNEEKKSLKEIIDNLIKEKRD